MSTRIPHREACDPEQGEINDLMRRLRATGLFRRKKRQIWVLCEMIRRRSEIRTEGAPTVIIDIYREGYKKRYGSDPPPLPAHEKFSIFWNGHRGRTLLNALRTNLEQLNAGEAASWPVVVTIPHLDSALAFMRLIRGRKGSLPQRKGGLKESDKLAKIRANGPYHHYHVTVKGLERFWVYDQLDFSERTSPDVLWAPVSAQFDDVAVNFSLKGYVMGDQLLLTEDVDTDSSATYLAIFPFFRHVSYAAAAHGLAFHEDWNTDPRFTPILISRLPLLTGIETGRVPEEAAKQLDRRWTDMMLSTPINLVQSWSDDPHLPRRQRSSR